MRDQWVLDRKTAFLNHGSFGATPRRVLDRQSELRQQLETEPVRFFLREGPALWRAALDRVADFLGAPTDELAFVRNASEGANAVLRSLPLEAGDEILVSDHGYPAVTRAAEYVADRAGASVRTVTLPFPPEAPEAVTASFLAAVTPRTRLVIVDHVTSPTGMVLPVASLVATLRERGVDTLVDGAHAPGMLDLDLGAVGAAYYVGNFHKWVCAPKGAGFLHVRADRQDGIAPPVVSHGWRRDLSPGERFRAAFDWTGTADPTAALCVPTALDTVAELGGGWTAIRERNRELTLEGRRLIAEALGVEPRIPESMIGTLASLPLPPGSGPGPAHGLDLDPLQARLQDVHDVVVPVFPWPRWPERRIRTSAHLHTERRDFERLAAALRAELA